MLHWGCVGRNRVFWGRALLCSGLVAGAATPAGAQLRPELFLPICGQVAAVGEDRGRGSREAVGQPNGEAGACWLGDGLLGAVPPEWAGGVASGADASIVPVLAPSSVFEVSPHVGLYVSVGALVDEPARGAVGEDRRRHVGSPVVGARMALRTNRLLRLEGSVGYSAGLVAVTDSASTRDWGAGVAFASLRGLLGIRSPARRGQWSIHGLSGIGVVSRHGAAWSGTRGTTDAALVVGAGAGLSLARSRGNFRLELEDYITEAEFARAGGRTRGRVHHDILWSIGFSYPLGGG
ncbi:MAG: hypothetical protein HY703_06985 [Gemmatimonadetes bacterium]|nr:hypothetical protein [Gemmatimonadota bacterium]